MHHPDFGKVEVCSCRKQALQDSQHRHIYQVSNLGAFEHMTFDTFNPQGRVGLPESQAMTLSFAFNQAQHFAQNVEGWLLMTGGYGCGKTHLAAAIAREAVSRGVPTLFLTVPDLLDWLRASFDRSDANYEERFNEIRNIQLLVLDDLGTQNATPWVQEKLFQIFDHRYVSRLPLVVTSNQDMDAVDGRIRSRLGDPGLVTRVRITAPDYRSPVHDSNHPQLSALHLHARCTFGNFSLREHEKLEAGEKQSLEKAFQAAQHFAEKPRGWLVFLGGYAIGKTHLSAAIGNYRHAEGEQPMFVVVPDLLDHLRATFSPSSPVSYDRLLDDVRTSPLLILDDLGTQSATPWAREKLYQILNYRYVAELPTVITSVATLDEMDERIRSRMLDKRICQIYLIDAPPYRPSGAGMPRGKTTRRT